MLSYFTTRKQRVKLGNVKSEWVDIKKGSAQGSFFGPFCYNVFTNDMTFILNDDVDLYNYADDNTLISSGYDYEDVKRRLLYNVNLLIKWFTDNYMKVNASKFQCIVFGEKDCLGTFNIDGVDIIPESNVKLLGLYIDNKLDFSVHIAHVCVKASRQLQVLARLSKYLDTSDKMLLYNSFMECYFNYCSIIWHFCFTKDTMKLEKLQKRALQFIFREFTTSYSDLLEKSGKCSVYIGRLRKVHELVYKIVYDQHPSYLQFLAHSNNNHTYNLRNTWQLIIPKFKSIRYGKHSISYLLSVLWNNLQDEMKYATNFNIFRSSMKEWTGQKCKCGSCLQCKLLML